MSVPRALQRLQTLSFARLVIVAPHAVQTQTPVGDVFVAAAAVALAVLAASLATLLVVRNQLRGRVDSALETQAQQIQNEPALSIERTPSGQLYLDVRGPAFGGSDFIQVVDPNGHPIRTLFDNGSLPVNDDARERSLRRDGGR